MLRKNDQGPWQNATFIDMVLDRTRLLILLLVTTTGLLILSLVRATGPLASLGLAASAAPFESGFERGVVHNHLYDLGFDDGHRHVCGRQFVHIFAPSGACTAPADQHFVVVGLSGWDPVVMPHTLPSCLTVQVFEIEPSIYTDWNMRQRARFSPDEQRRIDYPGPIGLGAKRGGVSSSSLWKSQGQTINVSNIHPGHTMIKRHVLMFSLDVQDAELDVLHGIDGVVAKGGVGVDVIIAETVMHSRRGLDLLKWFEKNDYIVFDFVPIFFSVCKGNQTRGCSTSKFAEVGRPKQPATFQQWHHWFRRLGAGQTDLLAVHRSFWKDTHLDQLKQLACEVCGAKTLNHPDGGASWRGLNTGCTHASSGASRSAQQPRVHRPCPHICLS